MITTQFQRWSNNPATFGHILLYTTIVLFTFLVSSGVYAGDPLVPGKKITKVMIDAGHGGHDPGNLCTKRYDEHEKDLALEISMKLGEKIKKQNPDVEVFYTRTTDVFVELHERTAMANQEDVDLFISVHCDAAGNANAKGSSTYVIGPAKTDANLRSAQRENASMLKEKDYKKNYSGFDPYSPESYIEISLRQNTHVVQSLSFAQKVQDVIRKDVKRKDRGVKQAPYWVISFTNMPSVLIELGFTTNREEEDFLRSSVGQDQMASAIAKAFGDYKSEMEGLDTGNDIIIDKKPEEKIASKEIVEVQPEEESPIPKEATGREAVVFKVQIATSSEKKVISPSNFKGVTGVSEYKSGGLFKYTIGAEKSYRKAKSLMQEMKTESYPGAFIVAFRGGDRIDLKEAMKD